MLDLGRIEDKLRSWYSEHPRGQPPADPVCLFRSLVIMVFRNETSLTAWVETLRQSANTDRILATLTGFPLLGQSLPGIGTYYRFFDRLIDGGPPSLYPPGQAPSFLRKQPALRPPRHIRKEMHKEFSQELDRKGTSQSQLLFESIREQRFDALPDGLLKRINELLFLCVVQPSADMGLFDDPQQLHLSGDGSGLVTGSNPVGQPSCNCRELGIFKCDHPRYYSDPKAEIGYDSHRKRFFFGHNLYSITFHGDGFDLPIFSAIDSSSETDYTLSIRSIEALLSLWQGYDVPWKIHSFAGDGHHDSYGVYHYLELRDILPVIPLHKSSKQSLTRLEDGSSFSENGVPLCPAGVEMQLQGRDSKKHSLVYSCPCKSKNAGALEQCPLATPDNPDYLCQPDTKFGPAKKIHSHTDPRLFPFIPRSSHEFKKLYNDRTSCERTNSTLKTVYNLEDAKHRHQEFWLIRATLIHFCHYLDTWFRRQYQALEMSVEQFLASFDQPTETAPNTG